ncbi:MULTISPECIES: hypothetical protein [Streptomyces]|uniref:Uncharacterized protein n=1 Tax=Streptomyces edwardsiae TaxID=3075527 RepID=A0ABU2QPM4_9ACTN|nr:MULTISPECIES: hypothetical protein [unclassified Streptomyces]MDT0404910.1 hypothetical protein [Streptomyces sp. DSM 41635]
MSVDRCLLQAPKSRMDASRTEDAARTVLPSAGHSGEARLIVADGSSGSAGSGWWANRLARDLCAAPGRAFRDAPAFDDVATAAALRWPGRQRALLAGVPKSSVTAWVAHDRIEKGPSATVLGVRLLPHPAHDGGPDLPGGGTWQAVSVGDSCMFQVRAGRVVESVAARTRVPRVVRAGGGEENPGPELRTGHWHPGDVFYLMTDALARWCFRHTDDGGRPWAALDAQCAAPGGFPDWVHDQRSRGVLEDDDITLLRAGCGPC